jgi:hypothetical protein
MRDILLFIIVGFLAGLWTYTSIPKSKGVFFPGTGKPRYERVLLDMLLTLGLSIAGVFVVLPRDNAILASWGAFVGIAVGGSIWARVHWLRQAQRDKEERARDELAAAKSAALDKPDKLAPPAPLSPTQSEPTRTRIFISYRRENVAHSGRIADFLKTQFGPDNVFMDVDAMRLGVDFVDAIKEEVAKCDVLLAAMGTRWLELLDANQTNLEDYVRVEIAAALKRKIPVIPILADGAKMPPADRLPEDLKELARRNALNVRHESFRADMDRLVRELKTGESS